MKPTKIPQPRLLGCSVFSGLEQEAGLRYAAAMTTECTRPGNTSLPQERPQTQVTQQECTVPKDTHLYPVFLDVRGLHCLLVGFGRVGRRKLAGLLPCGPASVLVLDTADPAELTAAAALHGETAALPAHPVVRFEQRACTLADLCGRALVFAAAPAAENKRIAALCREAGVFCNCAAGPESGTFHVPATARCGELAAALSTGGASPASARRWRGELEDWLAPRARTARLMGRLRPLVLALGNDTRQNTELFRALACSPLQQALYEGDLARCRHLLEAELPAALHVHIAELLDDLP